jgi:tetratricopeptide (TPR) repeat protein
MFFHTEHIMKKTAKKKNDTIAGDFAISLTEIENPAAADILRISAFLFPENIPEEILKEGIKNLGGHFEHIAEDPSAIDKALHDACQTGFLRHKASRKIFMMNPSIQTFLRQGMSEQRQWAEQAVRAVNNVFPEVEFENWSQCQRLQRNAQTCADLIIEWEFMFNEAAHLLSASGTYLHEKGQYAHARPLYERALAIREHLLGKTHPDLAENLNELASLYQIQGKYAQAKPLYHRALEIVEAVLDKEPSDKLQKRRATSFNNLGSLHKALKQFPDSKQYYEKALYIWENLLKEENEHVAATLNNFAGLYEAQGDYEQAKPMYERALEIWNEVLESEHPSISATINNLAGLYKAMGEDDKVQPLLEQALAIREEALGEDHPDVGVSLNNLAEYYKMEGKYAQAKSLYDRGLKILKKAFDSNHPHLMMYAKGYEDLLHLMKKPRKRRSKRRK